MDPETVIAFVNNAALLLAMALLYDTAAFKPGGQEPVLRQVVAGLILGAIGIALMLNRWDSGRGVVFDSRSVLLCVSGFFFGGLPVGIAVVMTGAFRLLSGGAGALTGVAVIVTSGGIGLAWRHLRRRREEDPSGGELYLLGIVVHVAMLAWMFSLPLEIALGVVSQVGLPVMVVFPLATAVLGKMLVDRGKRRRVEEALRRERDTIGRIMKTSPVGILQVDSAGHFAYANRRAEEILRMPLSEITERSIFDQAWNIARLDGTPFSEENLPFSIIQQTGEPVYDIRFAVALTDGTRVYLSVNAAPFFNSAGKFDGMMVTITDITENNRTEDALRESESFTRAVMDNLPIGVAVNSVDPEVVFTYTNDNFFRFYRIDKEALSGPGRFWEAVYSDPVFRQKIRQRVLDDCQSGDPARMLWEEVPVTRDGQETFYISAKNCPVPGKPLMISTVWDVTSHMVAAEALRESERRLKAIFDSNANPIVVYDAKGCPQTMNPAFTEVFGWTLEEVRCKPIPFVPEDQKALTKEKIDEIYASGHPVKFLAKRLTRQGKTLDVVISAAIIKGGQGKGSGMVVSLTDISEQRQLEQQLRQAQKMDSVGRLAGGVAHDYNNMLSVIIGYAEMVMIKAGRNEEIKADVVEILDAARRSAEITRKLLAYARKQTIAPKVLDLNETVEGMLKMLQRLIGENIDLNWQPGRSIWPVKMDPSQMDQVLTNLCVNARDAIQDVGRVNIETGMATFDEGYCETHDGFIAGEFTMLAVSDDGTGMDRETLGNIFEPFFTTKDVNKGTGLGLATIYGIVKQNQGFINVYSEPGQGTTFKVYLPRHEGEVKKKAVTEKAVYPSGHGETVLLVEDEPVLLKLGKRILDSLGYVVLSAKAPEEAIGLAKAHAGAVDLLITDVVMPGMNGRELAERLKALYPDLKVLFMSGYTAEVIAHRGVLDEGINFLQKPISFKAMAEKVREVLST